MPILGRLCTAWREREKHERRREWNSNCSFLWSARSASGHDTYTARQRAECVVWNRSCVTNIPHGYYYLHPNYYIHPSICTAYTHDRAGCALWYSMKALHYYSRVHYTHTHTEYNSKFWDADICTTYAWQRAGRGLWHSLPHHTATHCNTLQQGADYDKGLALLV